MESESQSNYKQLRTLIERTIQYAPRTPKDFDTLSNAIFQRTQQLISPTTLKRFWGYLNENVRTSQHTLNVLSAFLGYNNWQALEVSITSGLFAESETVYADNLSANCISIGRHLFLCWAPDRECVIRCISINHFEVVKSKHTKLQVGTMFTCNVFTAGLPLYLSEVIFPGTNEKVAYVAGKRNGIHYQFPYHYKKD